MKKMTRSIKIGLCCAMALFAACGGPSRPDPGEAARLYGSRASLLFTGGDLMGALAEYRKAYVAAAKVDLPRQQAQYLFNIGRVCYELGWLDSADNAFRAAYREFVFYRDSDNAGMTAGFIALACSQKGLAEKAFEWYRLGRPPALRNCRETAFWMVVQAAVSMAKERTPEAQGYLDRAMECCKKEKSYNGMAQVEYYRAAMAFAEGKHEEARELLARSLAYLDRAPERYRRWRVLLASATVSFCLKDQESGQRYCKRALDCLPRGIEAPPIDTIKSCPPRFWEGRRRPL